VSEIPTEANVFYLSESRPPLSGRTIFTT